MQEAIIEDETKFICFRLVLLLIYIHGNGYGRDLIRFNFQMSCIVKIMRGEMHVYVNYILESLV